MIEVDKPMDQFNRIMEAVSKAGIEFVIHTHEPTRTVEEAERNLSFDVSRLVKTIAFRMRGGRLVLAALRGTRRVDYAALAGSLGVTRRDLASLSPDEVRHELWVEPGSVSPVPLRQDVLVVMDEDVLTILPTLFCGTGRPDRTLELTPKDLVILTDGKISKLSR